MEICSSWQTLPQSAQTSAPGGGEEAIVANPSAGSGQAFHEVMRQHMLEEAADERFCTQGTPFFCAGLGVAIAKCHPVIFQLEEPVVAQGDPENVGS